MKTLVIGGAGFIGSHFTSDLLSDGHKGVLLEDFSSGWREDHAHLVVLPDKDRCSAIWAGDHA